MEPMRTVTATASAVPSSSSPTPPARNPGPDWGYAFLRFSDRVLPEFLFRPLRMLGTWFAVAAMPTQRRHSRAYLAQVLPRRPTTLDVFHHFFAFQESLILKLRVINGRFHRCDMSAQPAGFGAWLETPFPVLLGTFHVGVSDLLGFMLGGRHRTRIAIVRQRVGNSEDTARLGERFKDFVHFIWVNDPGEMIFALKEAAETSTAIALQCDRVDFSARTEAFEFLGARRLFPFTIYHLAILLRRPVVLSVGVQVSAERSVLYDSPVFSIAPGEPRSATLERARAHFQEFLARLESLLRDSPYVWFNFTALNPVAPAADKTDAGPR
jgi:predicted LPLAT superfamily acyltransferase